ncbi:Putative metabolite transport protein NicT [Paraburkholderia caffeinitolerans]|uniref:Metabolite transport protein NicT n=1 Tax=Paraburkholderia caffeinitolerans TaxID=1723730 RepID=A0A6J5GNH8_9BURK|nr:MFS transporter [Paraburkholderia caffeinitolerans]CAB3801581.1 Putative metabolite transport protein NicT [Paraburkholderia caffeinitolerans]
MTIETSTETSTGTSPARIESAAHDAHDAALARACRKAAWRIIPLVTIAYFFANLDRVNLSFAKLQMQEALKFSDVTYGIGAGLFAWGALLFQMPASLAVSRLGARRYLFLALVAWGTISALTMFTSSIASFYSLRFLLGVAEIGFFPAIVLYFSRWFPAERQSRIMSMFFLAMPLSVVFGGPLTGLIMDRFDAVAGLGGWQWAFLLEGVPAVLLGFAMLSIRERHADAPWLTQAEKQALDYALTQSTPTQAKRKISRAADALRHPLLWIFVTICFCFNLGNFGLMFWLPTLVHQASQGSNMHTALLAAIPYALGALAMVVNGFSAPREGVRLRSGLPALVGGAALAASVLVSSSVWASLILTSIAVAGGMATLSMFWSLPGRVFSDSAVATCAGMINMAAGLAFFSGPVVMGVLKQWTGGVSTGIVMLAASLSLAGLLLLLLPRRLIQDV